MHLDGQTIQSIAALLVGLSGLIGTVTAIINKSSIADFFKSRMVLVGDKQHIVQLMEIAKSQATASSANATSWESAWKASQGLSVELGLRVAALESTMKEVQSNSLAVQIRFKGLLKFTLDCFIYLVHLENSAASKGVDFTAIPNRPPIPPEFYDDLIQDGKPRGSVVKPDREIV